MKIRIFDDEELFSKKLLSNLLKIKKENSSLEFEIISDREFVNTIDALSSRQREFRKTGNWDDAEIILDKTDILIIDYDLINNKLGSYLTGEHVSYLARCFSKCSIIIGLNYSIYRDNGYDLTLQGNPQSYNDLSVGGLQVSNKGLWTGNFSGFRPWHWPILPQFLDKYQEKIKDVMSSIPENKSIWEVIGLEQSVIDLLPRPTIEFLGKDIKLTDITFKDFVLNSGNGLKSKDKHDSISDDLVARIGVSRISKWIERMILPGQDILIDCPHLISRFPSLLNNNAQEIENWNHTAQLTDVSQLGINHSIIEPFRFIKDQWVSRPVWFWDQIREFQEISEVSSPWKTVYPNWFFCEDASRFYKDNYQEFISNVESPYNKRFIRGFSGVEYRPQFRFLL